MKTLGRIVILVICLLTHRGSAQGYLTLMGSPFHTTTFVDPDKGLYEVSNLINQCNYDYDPSTILYGEGMQQDLMKNKPVRYSSFCVRKPEGCIRTYYRTRDTFLDSFPVNNKRVETTASWQDPENHCVKVGANYINIQVASQRPFEWGYQSFLFKKNYKFDWMYCLFTKFDSNFNILQSQRFLIQGFNSELQFTDSGFVMGFMLPNDKLQLMEFDWEFSVKKHTAYSIKDVVFNSKEFNTNKLEKGVFTLVKTDDNQGYWAVLSGMMPPEDLYPNYNKRYNNINWPDLDKLERKILLLKLDNNLNLVKTYQFNDGTQYGASFLYKRFVSPRNIAYSNGKLSFIFSQYSVGPRFCGILTFENPDSCSHYQWLDYLNWGDKLQRHNWFSMPNNRSLISTMVVDRFRRYALDTSKYFFTASLGFFDYSAAGWSLIRNPFSIDPRNNYPNELYAHVDYFIYPNGYVRDCFMPDNGSFHPKFGLNYNLPDGKKNSFSNGYSLGFKKSPLEICSYYRSETKLNVGIDTITGGAFFSHPNLQTLEPQPIAMKEVQWEIQPINYWGYKTYLPRVICSPFQPYVEENSFAENILVCDKDTAVLTASVGKLKGPYKIKWNTGDTTVSIVVRKSGSYSFTVNFPSGCKSPVSTQVTFATRKTQKPIADTIVCKNQSVLFNLYGDVVKNNWTEVVWSDTLKGFVQEISAPGVYRLKLRNASGCEFRDSFVFSNYKTPQLPAQRDSIYCLNQDRTLSYTLPVSASKGPFLWGASLNGESGTPNFYQLSSINSPFLQQKTYRLVNNSPGKQITVVQLKDGCGNLLSDTVVSFVRYPLQVEFLGDTISCAGDPVRLVVEASGGDTGAYQFIWNDGRNKGTQLLDYPLQTKQYFVTLKDNCTLKVATDTFEVIVVERLKTTVNDDQICKGTTYRMVPSITGGRSSNYRFAWSVSDPSAVETKLTELSLVVTPEVDFTGRFRVEDGVCPAAVDSGIILVREQPSAKIKQPATPACEPYTFNLQPLQLAQSPAAKWYWNANARGETQDAQGRLNEIVYAVSVNQLYGIQKKAGKYRYGFIHVINYTNGFYCADTFYVDEVVVKPRPKASGYSNPGSTNIDKPQVMIENTSITDSMSFVMDKMGDRLIGASNRYQFGDTGLFCFQVLATDKNGCSDTAQVYVRVSDVVKVFIPTAFTPNKDGLNEQFTLFLRGMKEYEMEVYDRWGGKVCTGNRANMKSEKGFVSLVDCALPQGVYVYNLRCIDQDNKPLGFSGTFTVLP